MKNFLYAFIAVFFLSLPLLPAKDYSYDELYSKDVPETLSGIWQGRDRLALFSSGTDMYTCVLRVFYQWYDDRAAESESYAQISSRARNDTTARYPENIELEFRTIAENSSRTDGAYELKVKYQGLKDYAYIPLAVIDGNIYMRFFVRHNFYDESGNAIDGRYFLADYGTASGLTISPPVIKDELLCYYVDGSSVYHIRYWLSSMDQTDGQAEFSDGDALYYVPKYIQVSENLYTCATGRSRKIRNIQKSLSLPYSFVSDTEGLIYAPPEPYLVRVPGSGTGEELLKTVEENNSRRHPAPKPLFPPADIDFHWKEISDLEKYNPYTWNRRNLDIHK